MDNIELERRRNELEWDAEVPEYAKDFMTELIDELKGMKDQSERIDRLESELEDAEKERDELQEKLDEAPDDTEELMKELIHRKLNGLANANHLVMLEEFFEKLT